MMDRLASLQKLGIKIGYAAGSHFSFRDEFDHFTPGILDGRSTIVWPVKLVEIDALDAQAAQRDFTFASDGRGSKDSLSGLQGIVRVPDEAAFCEDQRTFRQRQIVQKFSDHLFGVAESIHRRGIDPVDAQFQRMPHRGNRFRVILRPPTKRPAASADRPRAKSNCGYIETAGAQRTSRQRHDCASEAKCEINLTQKMGNSN